MQEELQQIFDRSKNLHTIEVAHFESTWESRYSGGKTLLLSSLLKLRSLSLTQDEKSYKLDVRMPLECPSLAKFSIEGKLTGETVNELNRMK